MPCSCRRASGFRSGLQFTASYTWSHSLDEQSGLGLFFTGNNPLYPEASYGLVGFRPDARVPDQLQLHDFQNYDEQGAGQRW